MSQAARQGALGAPPGPAAIAALAPSALSDPLALSAQALSAPRRIKAGGGAAGGKVYEEVAASELHPWDELTTDISSVAQVRRALDYLMRRAGDADVTDYGTSYRIQYAVWCFTNPNHVWVQDGWQVVYGDRRAGTYHGLKAAADEGVPAHGSLNAEIVTLVKEAREYAGSGSHAWDGYSRYYRMDTSGSNGYSDDLVKYSQSIVARGWGTVSLDKASADPSMTSGNGSYSLAGAVYGIYVDQACTQLVATMTTDESGHAQSGKVGACSDALVTDSEGSTYSKVVRYVKEISAPQGYALDTAAYPVTLKAGEDVSVDFGTASGAHEEAPQNDPTSVVAYKADADTGQASAQGGASLAGAEVTLRYYAGQYSLDTLPASPARTWVLRTNENGRALLDSSYKASGDAFYLNSDGKATIPLGTVTYQETKAPTGYKLNSEVFIRNFVSDGQGSAAVTIAQVPTIPEAVERGGIQVQKSAAPSLPEGGSLAGIVFEVVNASDGAVVVGGESYAKGEVVTTLTTDERGRASTASDALPYGTYTVREASVPASTKLQGGAADQTVDVHQDGVLVSVSFSNPQLPGRALFRKCGPDRKPLAGAKFELRGTGQAAGRTYSAASDSEGLVDFQGVQPGTYVLYETEPPAGHRAFSGSGVFAVEVKAGETADMTSSWLVDPAQEGSVRLHKTDLAGSGLAGAVFEVRRADGTLAGTMESGAGGWAELSGLELGSYTVRETEAPEGYELDPSWSFSFTLSQDGQVAEPEGDVVNPNADPPLTPATGGDARGRAAQALAGAGLAAAGLLAALRRRARA